MLGIYVGILSDNARFDRIKEFGKQPQSPHTQWQATKWPGETSRSVQSVFRLRVPSLRERTEDLPALFLHLSRDSGAARRLSPEQERLLRFYSWPGNLTELSTVCKRYAFLVGRAERLSPGARQNLLIDAIGEDILFAECLRRFPILQNPASADPAQLLEAMEKVKELLHFNNDKLGEKLSLSRTTLWRIKKAVQGAKT